MVITLSNEEIDKIIRKHIEEHFVPKYPGKWINYVRTLNTMYIGVGDTAEEATIKAEEAARRNSW